MHRHYGSNHLAFTLILPKEQRERLKGTCFRGQHLLAGNFCEWQCLEDVLADQDICRSFEQDVMECVQDMAQNKTKRTQYGVTIDHPHKQVGWASTAPVSQGWGDSALESFAPNRWTEAFRVNDRTILAPLTHLVTFVLDLKVDDNENLVFVRSVYPGQEVELGNRRGSRVIMAREAVFFDWQHPGQVPV